MDHVSGALSKGTQGAECRLLSSHLAPCEGRTVGQRGGYTVEEESERLLLLSRQVDSHTEGIGEGFVQCLGVGGVTVDRVDHFLGSSLHLHD